MRVGDSEKRLVSECCEQHATHTLTEWSLEVAVARGLAVYIYHECALCE